MEGSGHRVEVTVAAFQTLVDVEVGRRSGLPLAISRLCSPGNTALTFSEGRGNGPPFSCRRGRKGAFLIAECVFITDSLLFYAFLKVMILKNGVLCSFANSVFVIS